MNIVQALSIPGWMTEPELAWLAEAAAKSSCIAEIGSWRGRSTRAIADNTNGVVFCVDPWSDEAVGYPGWWTKEEAPEKYKAKDWLWREFQANVGDHFGSRVVPIRLFSSEGFEHARTNMLAFDMVFIDASHDFAHVRGDILMWRQLLRPGGVLCGHDYGDPTCPEVAPAVDQFAGAVEVVVGTIWRTVA